MEIQESEIQKIESLQKRLKEYEEDRYCPNRCVEYQLDKIYMYKQYFSEIVESTILLKSMLQNYYSTNSIIIMELEKIQKICNTANDPSKWV